MANVNELLEIIESMCSAHKGQFTWLDEELDDVIHNAQGLLMNFPSNDILDDVEVDFLCEDHHDGYIDELYVVYKDSKYNGLCFRIDPRVYDITNNDADEFGIWELNSDKTIQVIASEIYTELRKQLFKNK